MQGRHVLYNLIHVLAVVLVLSSSAVMNNANNAGWVRTNIEWQHQQHHQQRNVRAVELCFGSVRDDGFYHSNTWQSGVCSRVCGASGSGSRRQHQRQTQHPRPRPSPLRRICHVSSTSALVAGSVRNELCKGNIVIRLVLLFTGGARWPVVAASIYAQAGGSAHSANMGCVG